MVDADNKSEISRRQFLIKASVAGAALMSGRSKGESKPDYHLPPDFLSGNEQFWGYLKDYISSARQNIISYKNGEKVIIPSPAYASGIYGRDAFFSILGLADGQLSLNCYRQFERDQNPKSGQIPTQVLFNPGNETEKWCDDETTMLFLIWSGVVKEWGGNINQEKIEKSLEFVQQHVQDSLYYSDPGDFKYWADTLINPQKQVITYNQGLYCCALQTMFENNWGKVTFEEVEKAKEGYRAIWRQNREKGYLPQAQRQDLIDLSALFPEVLSRYLFNEPILSDQMASSTVDYFLAKALVTGKETGKLYGFKIICSGNGAFLSPKAISVSAFSEPGDYQNGGYWPMWTLVDLALAFKIAPKEKKEGYRQIILELLGEELDKDGEAKEYIRLCPDPVVLGSSEEMRHKYSWNVFFIPIARWAGLNR